MRITWEDAFRDVLRIEDNGSMSFLQLGKNKRRWDAPPKSRLQAVRVVPPPPLPGPTTAEDCRHDLLDWHERQRRLREERRRDPELYKRVGNILRKDYDLRDEAIYLALCAEVDEFEGGAKVRKRPDVNKEELKRRTMEKLRKAIKDCGPNTKPDTVIVKAHVNRNIALKCLRELEERGEYSGFSHRRRRS
jgi:hypothetical protein